MDEFEGIDEQYIETIDDEVSAPLEDCIYCNSCGAKNQAGARFCIACGQALHAEYAKPQQSRIQQETSSHRAPQPTVTYVEQKIPGNGKATGSLVCGIISLVTSIFFISIAGLILGIVGISLAGSARNEGYVGAKMTAGKITSIIGLVLSILGFVGCGVVLAVVGNASMGYMFSQF